MGFLQTTPFFGGSTFIFIISPIMTGEIKLLFFYNRTGR